MVHRPDKTYFRSDGDMSQIWQKHILDLRRRYDTDLTKIKLRSDVVCHREDKTYLRSNGDMS